MLIAVGTPIMATRLCYEDMWGRVCLLRNARRCIVELAIPQALIYHPLIVIGRNDIDTYKVYGGKTCEPAKHDVARLTNLISHFLATPCICEAEQSRACAEPFAIPGHFITF